MLCLTEIFVSLMKSYPIIFYLTFCSFSLISLNCLPISVNQFALLNRLRPTFGFKLFKNISNVQNLAFIYNSSLYFKPLSFLAKPLTSRIFFLKDNKVFSRFSDSKVFLIRHR